MPLDVCYEGKAWKVYYFSISDFVGELQDFARFLDSIDTTREEVIAIVPNSGLVKATVLLDMGFTGVKGYSIITKKRVESEQPNGMTITYLVTKGSRSASVREDSAGIMKSALLRLRLERDHKMMAQAAPDREEWRPGWDLNPRVCCQTMA